MRPTPSSPPPNPNGQWLISIPQPPPLMVAAVIERMKAANVKKAAYIGFSDSWGDLVYDATMKNVAGSSIEVVTNERYARADTSVTGQTLKIIAARPDALVATGRSDFPTSDDSTCIRASKRIGLRFQALAISPTTSEAGRPPTTSSASHDRRP